MDNLLDLQSLNWETEQVKVLKTKKKSTGKNFKLTREDSLWKLFELVSLMYLFDRFGEIEEIGAFLKDYHVENSLIRGNVTEIRAFYIQVLKNSDGDLSLIEDQKNKMANEVSVNVKLGSGIESGEINMKYDYEGASRNRKVGIHSEFISSALLLLHLGPPEECKYSKDQLLEYLETHTREAKKLLKIE